MKKIKTGKLTLSTETLAPLQADVLDHVAGGATTIGTTSILTRISCLSCVLGCGGGGQPTITGGQNGPL